LPLSLPAIVEDPMDDIPSLELIQNRRLHTEQKPVQHSLKLKSVS